MVVIYTASTLQERSRYEVIAEGYYTRIESLSAK